jgi:hypothetical protein
MREGGRTGGREGGKGNEGEGKGVEGRGERRGKGERKRKVLGSLKEERKRMKGAGKLGNLKELWMDVEEGK